MNSAEKKVNHNEKWIIMNEGDFSPIEYWVDERVKSGVWISQPSESLEHHVRNALLQKDGDDKEDDEEDYFEFLHKDMDGTRGV